MSLDALESSDWGQMLAARMVRNQAAKVTRDDKGLVTVEVTNARPRYLIPPLSWIIPHKPTRLSRLDRLGSSIWDLCDGTRTVEELIDGFATAHELTFHEARVSVTSYLKQLVQRGVLAVVMADS